MLKELEKIEIIARRNGFDSQADFVHDLIGECKKDQDDCWGLIDSNEVWGGSGSLVDISLSAYSAQPEEVVKKDEYEWRCAFIEIYDEMKRRNIINVRAEIATEAFRKWNENGVGI